MDQIIKISQQKLNVCIIIKWMLITSYVTGMNPGRLVSQTRRTNSLETSHDKSLVNIRNHDIKVYRETTVEKAIREKITDLKPFLQDDDEDKPNVEAESQTLIEFVPKNKGILRDKRRKPEMFEIDFNKYKKLKEIIIKALEKERVSKKTKKLVNKMIDDLLDKLNNSQCTWKSRNPYKAFRNDRSKDGVLMSDIWVKQWEKLKKRLLKNSNRSQYTDENFVFFEKFSKFYTDVINEVNKLTKRYRVQCNLYDRYKQGGDLEDKGDMKHLRQLVETSEWKPKMFPNVSCLSFKVCSEELREFMLNFYITLNDTAVNTLSNYAEMYVLDVNSDKRNEKSLVYALLRNISDIVQHKVIGVFNREIKKLKLDETKKTPTNVKIIRSYVRTVIERVKNKTKKHLKTGLSALGSSKVRTTIVDDVGVNLDVDLGNLEGDLIERICTAFSICNGRYINRRFDRFENQKQSNVDNNNLFVNVQLTLDEGIKELFDDQIRRRNSGFFRRNSETFDNVRFTKYDKIFNVTRTTYVDMDYRNQTTNKRSVLA